MTRTQEQKTLAAVSLAVTAVVVVIMAVWGFNAFTAPIDDSSTSSSDSTADDEATCAPGQVQTIVEYLLNTDVEVSVYNAGDRSGRAVATLNMLEKVGFRAGATGNAPSDSTVTYVEIHAKESDRDEAQLVAQNFNRNAQVVIDEDLAGPGVNVIIGDKFRRLKPGAPIRMRLPSAQLGCE